MTNLPKELKDKMLKAAIAERMYVEKGNGPEAYYSMMKYEVNDDRQDCFIMGFHYCYGLMLKTHVPKEKVDKLVEALEFYANKKNYSCDHDTYSLFSRWCILYGDVEEINESVGYSGRKAREALKEFESNSIK